MLKQQTNVAAIYKRLSRDDGGDAGSNSIVTSDSIDTFKGDSEIIPFKSVVNEYYAKDISRKVRSAYRTKALNGEFTAAYAPYSLIIAYSGKFSVSHYIITHYYRLF